MDDLIKQIGQFGENIDQTQGETVKSIFTRLIKPPAKGMTIDEMNKQLQELFGNLTEYKLKKSRKCSIIRCTISKCTNRR